MTNPGRDLVALRRQVSHVCPVCGQAFVARVEAKTCSNRCRQALKYQSQRAKKNITTP